MWFKLFSIDGEIVFFWVGCFLSVILGVVVILVIFSLGKLVFFLLVGYIVAVLMVVFFYGIYFV